MKTMAFIGLAVLMSGSFAHAAATEKFECVIEDSRSTDISSEALYLEGTGDNLYASIFKGDLAKGTGSVKPTSRTGDDRVYVQTSPIGDKVTVTLTLFGGALSLKQWKYAERLEASGVPGIQLRLGFCTSRVVQ